MKTKLILIAALLLAGCSAVNPRHWDAGDSEGDGGSGGQGGEDGDPQLVGPAGPPIQTSLPPCSADAGFPCWVDSTGATTGGGGGK
jgi:hypothetical protein